MIDSTKIKIVIDSKLSHLPLVRKAIRGVCSTIVQDEKIFQDIDLALTEALSNIIYHAYKNKPDHEIQIVIVLSSEEVIFHILDLGLKNLHIHNSTSIDGDFTNIDAIPEFGRGIFLMHKLMDEVTYTRKEGKNILSLRKCFIPK